MIETLQQKYLATSFCRPPLRTWQASNNINWRRSNKNNNWHLGEKTEQQHSPNHSSFITPSPISPTSLFPPPHIAKSPLGGCTSPSHPRHQLNFLVFEIPCLNGFRLAERPICISTVPCLSSSRRCPSDPTIFLKESWSFSADWVRPPKFHDGLRSDQLISAKKKKRSFFLHFIEFCSA